MEKNKKKIAQILFMHLRVHMAAVAAQEEDRRITRDVFDHLEKMSLRISGLHCGVVENPIGLHVFDMKANTLTPVDMYCIFCESMIRV